MPGADTRIQSVDNHPVPFGQFGGVRCDNLDPFGACAPNSSASWPNIHGHNSPLSHSPDKAPSHRRRGLRAHGRPRSAAGFKRMLSAHCRHWDMRLLCPSGRPFQRCLAGTRSRAGVIIRPNLMSRKVWNSVPAKAFAFLGSELIAYDFRIQKRRSDRIAVRQCT